jgi:hypothetical protein
LGKSSFIADLILNPSRAIDTIQRNWSLPKTAIIFVLTFLMVPVNFLLVNFTGNVLGFAVYGVAFGLIMESLIVFPDLLLLYLLLRLTKWGGQARLFLKASSWLMMIPAMIYYLITLPIFVVLRLALQEGFGVYLYQTAKLVMYLWINSLLIVAATKDVKQIRIAHVAAVILAFAVTYVFVIIVNYNLVSLITSRVEV